MAQGLEKPGAISAFLASSGAGSIGLLVGEQYTIKVNTYQFVASTPVAEITGDGDITPVFEHNTMLYGQITLSGWMVAGLAIGFENLPSTTNNVGAATVTLTYGGGSQNLGPLNIVYTQCAVNWSHTAPYVGVAFSGMVSGTAITNFES